MDVLTALTSRVNGLALRSDWAGRSGVIGEVHPDRVEFAAHPAGVGVAFVAVRGGRVVEIGQPVRQPRYPVRHVAMISGNWLVYQ